MELIIATTCNDLRKVQLHLLPFVHHVILPQALSQNKFYSAE